MNKQELIEWIKTHKFHYNESKYSNEVVLANELIDFIKSLQSNKSEPKKSAEEIEEAKSFIKQWPDREDYVNKNFKSFLTRGEADDDSIDLADYWDEQYKLSKTKKQPQSHKPERKTAEEFYKDYSDHFLELIMANNVQAECVFKFAEEYAQQGIELPSDEEIHNWAYDESQQNICGDYEKGIAKGKEIGAKWFKQLIQK